MAGGAARLVGAAGVVAVAAAAHVTAGADLPAPGLLALLILILTGLAELASHLPPPARSVRVRLAAAVAVQPVLHGLFDRADGHPGVAMTGPLAMPVAHLAAATVGAWWLARGAERMVVAVGAAVRRVRLPSPVAASAPGRIGLPVRPTLPLASPFSRAVRRRGPPVARSVCS